MMKNNSYFTKHKVGANKSKGQASGIPKQSRAHEVQAVEVWSGEQKPVHPSFLNLSLGEEKSEEQKVYEEYKQIKANYEQELAQLSLQIERLQKEAENEMKKVKHAETTLEAKKKDLRATKQRHDQMKREYQKQETEPVSWEKIGRLEKQLAEITQSNVQKIRKLQEEEERVKGQNRELESRLKALEEQYSKSLQLDQTTFEQQKKSLEAEQSGLKQDLESLQQQSEKIRKDIQKIQEMKPVSGDVHKRYLDLFEKMFISQEIAKAEKIMTLREEERKYSLELGRRKEWLNEKQKEIQEREGRVAEKNRLVDKLTAEIREKSTLLLTKYQVEADKHKK